MFQQYQVTFNVSEHKLLYLIRALNDEGIQKASIRSVEVDPDTDAPTFVSIETMPDPKALKVLCLDGAPGINGPPGMTGQNGRDGLGFQTIGKILRKLTGFGS